MRALVTGGAGFIGSHLSELLLDEGFEVFALDDLSTGEEANIAQLRDREGFHLVVDSVLSQSVVSELVHRCDVVYHLAAAVGVRLIVEQPGRTLLTNVQGAENVLDYCARFEKPVLIASSSEVYGNHPEDVLLEEDAQRIYGPTTAKRWAYADTKALDEFLALALRHERGLRLRDRAPLQHRRAAAEQPLRERHPALRAARAGRGAARDPRRREPDAVLLPRLGRRACAQRPARARRRRDLQRRLDRPDHDRVERRQPGASSIAFVPYERVPEEA